MNLNYHTTLLKKINKLLLKMIIMTIIISQSSIIIKFRATGKIERRSKEVSQFL